MNKRDFKLDKRADKYDDHFEGRLSRKFYELQHTELLMSQYQWRILLV